MSDEEQAPPVEDTSVPAVGQEPAVDSEELTYRKRYDDIRPQMDRITAEISEYRQAKEGLRSDDPETRQAAAQFLGIEFAEDEETFDEFADPTATLAQEIAQIKAELAQQKQTETQQAQEQRDVNHIGAGLIELQGRLGRNLTEDEVGLIGDAAMQNRDGQGLPNIAHVSERFEQVLKSQVRTRPKAPHISASGTQAEQTVRLDDPNLTRQERHDLMYERMQANEM